MSFNIMTPTYNVQGVGMVELQYRQLRARWSQEAMDDLRAMHNINAEAVLTEMLAAELNQEIDQEVTRDIRGFFRSKKATRFLRKVNWKKEGF